MYESFNKMNLTVVELPIELVKSRPVYRGYIRELPFLTGEGCSKVAMYRQLMENYHQYVEEHRPQEEEKPEEMTSSFLSVEDLLKYYDGETFDGFSYDFEREQH